MRWTLWASRTASLKLSALTSSVTTAPAELVVVEDIIVEDELLVGARDVALIAPLEVVLEAELAEVMRELVASVEDVFETDVVSEMLVVVAPVGPVLLPLETDVVELRLVEVVEVETEVLPPTGPKLLLLLLVLDENFEVEPGVKLVKNVVEDRLLRVLVLVLELELELTGPRLLLVVLS
jgi:hypothetical protein